ncbi:Polyamine ABC transporter substrate-binding protein [Rhodovastum atsumiense]|uniref:Polyamine ABC transporter substrate-binding protein n=1 Tax=Rhodovastum atsumiense TaxID=504468 RepID=A0A5M6INS9_9PROT|nr:ABC transporter substrate-binding protein [Rhodovastum atsumiense]KAA5609910.1 polyamine ABC transporter substrate-binding protein [Rhodovastum atsumiense]CAH2604525.1 Polyamine ABC transporter substrate-binding protein [Rhodovastum atsumiense]
MTFRAALLAAAFAVPFAATLPASAQAAPRTTLVVGMAAQDVGRLDPHFAVSTIDRTVVAWMFNGLVRFRPGSMSPTDIEPDLAERWEASADKTVWTFHLRHGVKFHGDYGEVTADDVVFSLQKAADPKRSAFSADYAAFDKVEAIDPYTVRITLKQQVPSLLGIVTNYAGGFIVSRKAVEALGDGFARAPIGSGPFAYASLTPNQSLELVAHKAYFRGAPKLERISYRFLPSTASRDLAFQNGELDLEFGMQDQTWVNRARKMPNAVVDVFEPGEEALLHLNMAQKPLDDIRVRQAIAYAINRPEILRWQGAEISRQPGSVIPIGNLGYTAENGLPQFNLNKAKQLLAEAGYPQGLTLKVIHTQLPNMLAQMQVVQAQLKRAGINLDLQVVEHATYHQMIRQDLSSIVSYTAARFPVADVYLTQFYHSRSTVKTPTAVTNFSHCTAADAEIDAARTEPDEKKQIALWQTAQRKIVTQLCAVPLIETLQAWVRRDSLDYGYTLKGSLSLGPVITETTHFK